MCIQALNWDSNEKSLDLLLSFSIPLLLPAGISAYSFIDVHKLFQRLFWRGGKIVLLDYYTGSESLFAHHFEADS